MPAVALIGARKCSGYGAAMAKLLGQVLAERGIAVVSGMARGVDGIGQKAACEAGGVTFAVLGCGVDVIYPAENKELYRQILTCGGIISEYIPGTAARPSLFPPRNRIISGLADVVVVVEAGEKSGTMITVDMALEQGREVYALPGRLVDRLSSGCNQLIKHGAGMVLSLEEFADDILAEWQSRQVAEVSASTKRSRAALPANATIAKGELDKEEKAVLAVLDYTPVSLEQIGLLCPQLTYERLLKVLIGFCLKGVACQMGAGNYCLKA
jgi:DNA processing protein